MKAAFKFLRFSHLKHMSHMVIPLNWKYSQLRLEVHKIYRSQTYKFILSKLKKYLLSEFRWSKSSCGPRRLASSNIESNRLRSNLRTRFSPVNFSRILPNDGGSQVRRLPLIIHCIIWKIFDVFIPVFMPQKTNYYNNFIIKWTKGYVEHVFYFFCDFNNLINNNL